MKKARVEKIFLEVAASGGGGAASPPATCASIGVESALLPLAQQVHTHQQAMYVLRCLQHHQT